MVLLRVGFTLPFVLPRTRCALTAPFHPYRSTSVHLPSRRYIFCGTVHRLAPSRRYLAPCPVEPGLSSATHRGASFQDARRNATAAARPTPSKTILPGNEYGKSDCALVMGSQLKELAVIIVFPPTEKPNSSLCSGGWRQVITEYSKKLIRSDHRLRVRVPAAL